MLSISSYYTFFLNIYKTLQEIHFLERNMLVANDDKICIFVRKPNYHQYFTQKQQF
jgi:hypothetical protein